MNARPLLVIALALSPSLAHAQGPADVAAAQALFEQGREQMARGDFTGACAKLEESQRLAPAPGTAFNLADCYAHLGRVASAWSLFRDVEAEEKLAEHAARTDLARKRATELEPALPRLIVHVAEPVAGIEVKRDGAAMGPAQWETALPVDPGAHVLVATAPGKRRWRTTVAIAQPGESVTVVVPPLEDAPIEPPPRAAIADPGDARRPWQRGAAIATMAGGGAFLVAAGVTVAIARSEYDAASASCDGSTCRTADGVARRREARTLGDVATALGVIGAVGVAAGGVMWLTAPSDPRAPRVGVGPGALFVRGAW